MPSLSVKFSYLQSLLESAFHCQFIAFLIVVDLLIQTVMQRFGGAEIAGGLSPIILFKRTRGR
jgi:hypothetical protein